MASALSGQTVSGEVRQANTGIPIRIAAVVLVDVDSGVELSVLTDIEGKFTIRAPHEGDYRIRVQRSGYSTFEILQFHLSSSGVTRLDIRL